MKDPKDKKKKTEIDTDYSDEMGGGANDEFSKDDFMRVLDRAISPPKSPDQKTGETSE